MRHAAPRRLPLRIAMVASALGWACRVQASTSHSIVEYSTSGTIGTANVAGTPVVRFQGVADGFLSTPNPLRSGAIPVDIPAGNETRAMLGSFVASTPPADGLTAYSHTPFAITMHVKSVDGQAVAAGQPDVTIRGWLDGTLAGASPSSITAHYALSGMLGIPWEPRDSVGSFRTGLATQTLTIPRTMTTLDLPSARASSTAVSALLVTNVPLPSPAPEPGPIAVFAIASAAALAARIRARMNLR